MDFEVKVKHLKWR